MCLKSEAKGAQWKGKYQFQEAQPWQQYLVVFGIHLRYLGLNIKYIFIISYRILKCLIISALLLLIQAKIHDFQHCILSCKFSTRRNGMITSAPSVSIPENPTETCNIGCHHFLDKCSVFWRHFELLQVIPKRLIGYRINKRLSKPHEQENQQYTELYRIP